METQLGLFESNLPKRPRSPEQVYQLATAGDLATYAENDLFEHKPVAVHSNELGEYVCMWANTKPDGGLIVIGLSNLGEKTGCVIAGEEKINNLKKAGQAFCPDAYAECREVPFTNANNQRDFLLLIRVRYHGRKVVRHVNGKAYWRIGDAKKEISPDLIRILESDMGQVPFEQEECNLVYPDDFDAAAITIWAGKVIENKGWIKTTSNEDILANLHLGRFRGEPPKFLPNMACALLFAKDPILTVSGCRVHLLRFAGEKEGTGAEYAPLKDDFVEGTVPQLIERTKVWLNAQLRSFTRYGQDGKFHTSQEYPSEAWYEAIVNACVHRSYALKNAFISVKMFNDNLTIESPGGFMPSVSPENIYDVTPHPRNPNLYHAMWFIELVRCNNEGAKRIRDYMAKDNLPPAEFSERSKNYSFVRVTLRNDIKHRKIWSDEDSTKILGEQVFGSLSDDERKVVNYVLEFSQINVSDAQRLTKFSWPRSRRLLLSLAEDGILEQHRDIAPGKDRNPKAHFTLKRRVPGSNHRTTRT